MKVSDSTVWVISSDVEVDSEKLPVPLNVIVGDAPLRLLLFSSEKDTEFDGDTAELFVPIDEDRDCEFDPVMRSVWSDRE